MILINKITNFFLNLRGDAILEIKDLNTKFHLSFFSNFKLILQAGVNIHIVIHINSNPTHDKQKLKINKHTIRVSLIFSSEATL